MLLGLDIGTKRTGVAISAGHFAQEYTTLTTDEQLAEHIALICWQEKVERIIIGMPYLRSGDLSTQAAQVQSVADEIKKVTGLPVDYEDEILTTNEAKRLLQEAGTHPSIIEQRIDQAAARLILQQYLDASQRGAHS